MKAMSVPGVERAYQGRPRVIGGTECLPAKITHRRVARWFVVHFKIAGAIRRRADLCPPVLAAGHSPPWSIDRE
jgi:hypothetical protein